MKKKLFLIPLAAFFVAGATALSSCGEQPQPDPGPVETVSLDSIAITTNPSKMKYTVGESFDATGMVVTATMSDGNTKDVSANVSIDKTAALTKDDTTITVSYTEGDVTKSATLTIEVVEAGEVTAVSIDSVVSGPTECEVGDEIKASDYVLKIEMSDGSFKEEAATSIVVDTSEVADSVEVTLGYGELETIKTSIKVNAPAPHVIGDFYKVKSQDEIVEGTYIIVHETDDGAQVFSGVDAVDGYKAASYASKGHIGAAQEGAKVLVEAMEGGFSMKVLDGDNAGKYMYNTSSSNGLKFGTEKKLHTIEHSADGDVIVCDSTQLMFNANEGQNRFRYYTKPSQKAIALYKLEEAAPRDVASIVITDYPHDVYQNEDIELAEVKLTVNYADEGDPDTNVTPESITFSSAEVGSTTLVATYKGVSSEPVSVNVLDARVLDSIEITDYPTEIFEGGTVSKEEVKIKLIYNQGDPVEDVTPDSVALGAAQDGVAKLTATYGDKESAPVDVAVKAAPTDLTPIAITSNATVNGVAGIKSGTGSSAGSTTIKVPEDSKVLGFKAVGWNGEEVEITITGYGSTKVIPLTSNAGIAGSKTDYTLVEAEPAAFQVYVDLGGILDKDTNVTISATKGCRFVIWDVGVVYDEDATIVTGVEITKYPTEIYDGDSIEAKDVEVSVTYKNGKTKTGLTPDSVLLGAAQDGVAKLTAKVGDIVSAEVDVTVKTARVVTLIEITSYPTKIFSDETITKEDVKVKINYNEGDPDTDVTPDSVSLGEPQDGVAALTATVGDETSAPVNVSVEVYVTWEKAADIVVGDVVTFVNEEAKVELGGFSTSSTIYGIADTYTTRLNHKFPLEVVAGSADDSFAFKSGDNYVSWSSGNSLTLAGTEVDENSSWTVGFDTNGNALIKNVKDETRVLFYNSGSPRFACYTTTSNKPVQLYRVPRTVSAVTVTSVPAAIYEGDVIDPADVEVTVSYSNGASKTGVHPDSVRCDTQAEGASSLYATVAGVESEGYAVTVLSSRVLTGVEITDYPKTVEVNGTIAKEDVKVTLTYSKGDPDIDVTPDSVSLGDTSEAGTAELTATVGTITSAAVNVSVKAFMNLSIPMTGFSEGSSYVVTNETKEVMGVTYGSYNYNPSNGQVRGSNTSISDSTVTANAGNWDFYNKTALTSSVQTITVSSSAVDTSNLFQNNLYLVYGNESVADVTSLPDNKVVGVLSDDKSSFTFDVSDISFSFFKICSNEKFTKGTVKNVSVILRMEKPEGGIKVDSVKLNKNTLTLARDATETLEATVGPDYADNKAVEWTTAENDGVISVDQTGKVTALKEGTAKVVCTAVDGSGVSDTCEVTVGTPIPSTTSVASIDCTKSLSGVENVSTLNVSLPSGKAYYQDSGTKDESICTFTYKAEDALWSNTPLGTVFKATIGGGSAKEKMTYAVEVVLLDADGNEISGTKATITQSVKTANGDNYEIVLANVEEAYGFKVTHMKENGWNARYFSFDLQIAAAK